MPCDGWGTMRLPKRFNLDADRSTAAHQIRKLAWAVALFWLLAAVATSAVPVARAEGPWSTGWSDGQPSNNATIITAHPNEPTAAYLGTAAGLYRTSNGGASWTVLSGALANPLALVVAPGVPHTLYTYAQPADGNGGASRSA